MMETGGFENEELGWHMLALWGFLMNPRGSLKCRDRDRDDLICTMTKGNKRSGKRNI